MSYKRKMRKKFKEVEREADLGVWHKWFAWYPIRIGGNDVWLKWVFRKKSVIIGHTHWRYEHNLPIDELLHSWKIL